MAYFIKPRRPTLNSHCHNGIEFHKYWWSRLTILTRYCSGNQRIILLSVVFYMLSDVTGFNVDVDQAVVHSGNSNSYFGYSVAQHGEWLIVGAPKSTRHDMYITGDVVKCKVDAADDCRPMDGFHASDKKFKFASTLINRSEQWLGATVTTSSVTGHIAACAPRMWFHRGLDEPDYNQGSLVGGCYVQAADGQYTRYDPCIDPNSGLSASPNEGDTIRANDRQFMCSAGLSAVFNKNGKRLVMGAPGSLSMKGQLIMQQVGSSDIYNKTRRIYNPALVSGYLGLSLDTGKFSSGGYYGFVAGAPRVGLSGKVYMYNHRLELNEEVLFSGDQIGEYFGNSLTVGDFNGDKLDDVVVGAPFYSKYELRKYDIGRVIVFYQDTSYKFDDPRVELNGPEETGGRFGYTLANAKDLNRDGYQDLAVGAPYAGDNKGAVYLYYGSTDGLRLDYSQVIYGKDIQSGFSTFGHAISAGQDQDANEYPDLIVGAYDSDKAVYLRARPIVSPTVVLLTPGFEQLNIDQKNCTTNQGKQVACFNVKACVTYTGDRVPDNINFNFLWTLDMHKEERNKRIYFLQQNNQQTHHTEEAVVYYDKATCLVHQMAVKENIRDKLFAITIGLAFNIKPDLLSNTIIKPIQNDLLPKESMLEIPILKYCGSDDICVPDLLFTTISQSLKTITYGQTSPLDINISISNDGEDSYESMVYTQLPKGINYINVQTLKAETTITCSTTANINGSIVVCNIGNPLPATQAVKFNIRTTVKVVDFHRTDFTISFLVNSTNKEKDSTLHDNSHEIKMNLIAEANIKITGTSQPEEVLYNVSDYETDIYINDTKPKLTHLYEIRNTGPSSVSKAEVDIYWPSYDNNHLELLKLVNIPNILDTSGKCCNGFCTTTPVNLTNLEFAGDMAVEKKELGSTQRSTKNDLYFEPEQKMKFMCSSKSTECILIHCQVNSLTKDQSVIIQINSTVMLDNLIKNYNQYDSIIVSSVASVTVTEFPYAGIIPTNLTESFQVKTTILATKPKAKRLPIWIIIVALVCGLLLLVIIVVILRKCGFFKRKKKDDLKRLTIIGKSGDEDDSEASETDPINAEDKL